MIRYFIIVSMVFSLIFTGCVSPIKNGVILGEKSPLKSFFSPSPCYPMTGAKKFVEKPLCFSGKEIQEIVKKLQERRVKLEYCQKRFEEVKKAFLEQKGICLKKPEKKPNNGPWIAFSVGFLAGGVTLALVVVSVLSSTK